MHDFDSSDDKPFDSRSILSNGTISATNPFTLMSNPAHTMVESEAYIHREEPTKISVPRVAVNFTDSGSHEDEDQIFTISHRELSMPNVLFPVGEPYTDEYTDIPL